jgi:hypothetical protein
VLAKRIIALAQQGERDAERLAERVVRALVLAAFVTKHKQRPVGASLAGQTHLTTFRRKISVFRIVADDARKARPAGGWPAGVEERD